MSDEKITEALIDPRWETGVLMMGEAKVGFFRLHHPAIGPITSLVPKEIALRLGELLTDLGNSL